MNLKSSPATQRNIEIKARLSNLDAAAQVAASLGADRQVDQFQVDTYFRCSQGRLKLREINEQSAQLIAYQRPNEAQPKGSDYILCPISEAQLLKESLAAACGILATVRKHRRIYLFQHVRIHLDRVESLGDFLEFEAVLGADVEENASRELLADLLDRFSIDASDLLPKSYGELILEGRH